MTRHIKPLSLVIALSTGFTATQSLADIRYQYAYNDLGQITEVDGPRQDVSDITRYDYYSQSDVDQTGLSRHHRNKLKSVTNALGHQTTLSEYNAYGYAQRIVDPRGVVTRFNYDANGRLTELTVQAGTDADPATDVTTRFTYSPVGLITQSELADGQWLRFSYDAARRLTRVENNLGEAIAYTLDAMGNITAETVYGQDSGLQRQVQQTFDKMGRLLEVIGNGAQERSQFQYDVNSNQTGLTDANLNQTSQAYDALQRLVSITDAHSKVTQLSYDLSDNLTSVTDPRGTTTLYEYDSYNRVIRRISPDTGTTEYTYDDASNITTSTDARGIRTEYLYDALNRLTSKQFPADTSATVTFAYDEAPTGHPAGNNVHHGIGQLTSITDSRGTDTFSYGFQGTVLSHQRQTHFGTLQASLDTQYVWSKSNQLTQLTYPSGLTVDYQRNSAQQVESIRFSFNGQQQTVASGIAYQAFGPLNTLTWGNGLTLNRSYNSNGQLTAQQIPNISQLNYNYDRVGNITGITDAQNRYSYTYDALYRLVLEDGAKGIQRYSYDDNGNRTERGWDKTRSDGSVKSLTQTLAIESSSNRLSQIGKRDVVYSDNGSILVGNVSKQQYVYNNEGRLSEFHRSNKLRSQYAYNGTGERILKHRPGSKAERYTLFSYDLQGQLIAEAFHDQNNKRKKVRHYIWLDQLPVAMIEVIYKGNGAVKKQLITYLHSDHLNTPRLATNDAQVTVWRWESNAFGAGAADLNPDGDKQKVVMNLRFPGQYYDSESGLHYNYYRDYDPRTGRYIQSDPIGLKGGLNTYGYVHQNPLKYTDPKGLAVPAAAACALNPACVAAAATATAEACAVVGAAAYTGYQAFKAWGAYNDSDEDWMNDIEGPLSPLPPGYFDQPLSGTGGPDWDPDEDDGNKTPGNNQAQNKEFHDATRGLTKSQKRRVHDEITGKGYSYKQIKEIADAVKSGRF